MRHLVLALALFLAFSGGALAQHKTPESSGGRSGGVLPPPSYPKILPFNSPLNGKFSGEEEADAFFAVVRLYQTMMELDCSAGDDRDSARKYYTAREAYYDGLRKYVNAFSRNAEDAQSGDAGDRAEARKELSKDFENAEAAIKKNAKPIVCPPKLKKAPVFISPFGTEDFDGNDKQDFDELVGLYEIKLTIAKCGPGAVHEDEEFPRPKYEDQLRAYILYHSGRSAYFDVKDPETNEYTRENWAKDKALVEEAVRKKARRPSCPTHDRHSSKKHQRAGRHGHATEDSPFYMENYPAHPSSHGSSSSHDSGESGGWQPAEPPPETGTDDRAPTQDVPQPPDQLPGPP